MGGNLTDEQLKEFDAYLNGAQPAAGDDSIQTTPAPRSDVQDAPAPKEDLDYLNKIIDLHSQKAEDIMDLLDRIDAKSHKDIVADLVDEMQYQKGVVKREEAQLARLRQLFIQAKEAVK